MEPVSEFLKTDEPQTTPGLAITILEEFQLNTHLDILKCLSEN